MNLITTDLNNINNVIDLLKSNDDRTKEQLLYLLKSHTVIINEILEGGWPEQEICFVGENKNIPAGIPIVLARMMFTLLQYCAANNIDLVNAMEILYGSEARNHS
jgi:hypothetical protein